MSRSRLRMKLFDKRGIRSAGRKPALALVARYRILVVAIVAVTSTWVISQQRRQPVPRNALEAYHEVVGRRWERETAKRFDVAVEIAEAPLADGCMSRMQDVAADVFEILGSEREGMFTTDSTSKQLLLVAARLKFPRAVCSPLTATNLPWTNPDNVAVCLTGPIMSSKSFDLFQRYVVEQLDSPDVFAFFTSPRGVGVNDKMKQAYKSIRIFSEVPYDTVNAQDRRLTEKVACWGSDDVSVYNPAVLKYFAMVGQCQQAIEDAEQRRGKVYDWITLLPSNVEFFAAFPLPSNMDPSLVYVQSTSVKHLYDVHNSLVLAPRKYADAVFDVSVGLSSRKLECPAFRILRNKRDFDSKFLSDLFHALNLDVGWFPAIAEPECLWPICPSADETINDAELRFYGRMEELEAHLMTMYRQCACQTKGA